MIKKRYILGIFLLLFMVIAMASAVDDVSAAKYTKYNSGTKVFSDGFTSKWVAYSNGKNIKSTCNAYMKKGGKDVKIGTVKVNLVKVGKNKLKWTKIIKLIGANKKTETRTVIYKSSTKSYYKKYIIPYFKS